MILFGPDRWGNEKLPFRDTPIGWRCYKCAIGMHEIDYGLIMALHEAAGTEPSTEPAPEGKADKGHWSVVAMHRMCLLEHVFGPGWRGQL